MPVFIIALAIIITGFVIFLISKIRKEQKEEKPEITEEYKKTHTGTWFNNTPI